MINNQDRVAARSSPSLALLAALFFMSGFGALVLQVVWQRRLSLLFGNTVQATGAVLAAFLGGLAIGSAWFGPVADRTRNPLRLLGLLELGVAGGALLSLAASGWIGELGAIAFRHFGGESAGLTAARCLLAFALVGPSVIPMGGSLPVLATLVDRARRPAQSLGFLYAVNTLGAAFGALATAFVLVVALGFRGSWLLAAGIDLALGIILLIVARPLAPPASPAESPAAAAAPATSGGWNGLLTVVVFGSGAVFLALEVLWTRALVLHFGTHVATFALVLAIVLVGLSVGGAVGGWAADRVNHRPLLIASAAIGASVAGAFGLVALRDLSDFMATLGVGLGISTYWGLAAVNALAVARVALLPACLAGAILPIAWREARSRGGVGRMVGLVTAASTAGTLVGSLAAAFLLVPMFGVGRSFAIVLGVEFCLGLTVLIVRARTARSLAFGALSLLAFGLLLRAAMPLDQILLTAGIFTDESTTILLAEDGLHGLVTVEDRVDGGATYRSLSVNGVNVAGTAPDLVVTQKMQAHIPLLLHAEPRSILHIGVGSGGTAASAGLHPLDRIDIVELNPQVPIAADRFMRDMNHGFLTSDPRVNLIYGDGRTYLMATAHRYDVILSDSIHPRYAGNGALYTRDYYEICRSRLEPGGIVSQWLPLYSLPPAMYQSIVAAFLEVFPDSTLWYVHDNLNPHTILVGARDGFQFGAAGIGRRLDANGGLRDDLASINIHGADDFLANFLVGKVGLTALVAGADVHTDDRPLVEYTAGRMAGDNHFHHFYQWTWSENFRSLLEVREPWPGLAANAVLGARLTSYRDTLWRAVH